MNLLRFRRLFFFVGIRAAAAAAAARLRPTVKLGPSPKYDLWWISELQSANQPDRISVELIHENVFLKRSRLILEAQMINL